MLFKIAFTLLAIWLLGVAGAYEAGKLVHLFLMVALMLLLLAVARSRDEAIRHEREQARQNR